MIVPLAPVLIALAGCRGHPPRDDSGPPDAETGHTGDATAEFVVTSVDGETWAADGYEIVEYGLSADAVDPYASLFEGRVPTFYVLRPTDPGEVPRPVLTWFHGGVTGDDSTADVPYSCEEKRVFEHVSSAVTENFLPVALARRNGWAIVAPRNDWCDAWTGRGPDDPIDPEHHFGYHHVSRVLDFVLGGGAGFVASGDLYGWGTSMGGTGAIIAASRYEPFDGVIMDSAPSSMFYYYEVNHFGEDDLIMIHYFGGPPFDAKGGPTEWWDNYAAASAETLVSQGRMTDPLYAIYNAQDTLSEAWHTELLVKAMEATYPATVRHGSHDFDHAAPGTAYHTQSMSTSPPWGYTGTLLTDFLGGSWLAWAEAEDGCGADLAEACTVGEVLTSAHTPGLSSFSRAAVRQGRPEHGTGVIWCDRLPAGIAAGEGVEAVAVLTLTGLEKVAPYTVVAVITWEEPEATTAFQPIQAQDAASAEEGLEQAFGQYEATRLAFVPTDPAAGRVCVEYKGMGTLDLDAVVFTHP